MEPKTERLSKALADKGSPALMLALEAGGIHALIDAASAAILYFEVAKHQMAYQTLLGLVLVYNLLAFGVQWLVGMLADARNAYRSLSVAGTWMLALAAVWEPARPWLGVALAGIGNACFHVGAGGVVLRQSCGRATEAGVFVAPGAIGLAVGLQLGMQPDSWRGPLIALLILAGARLVRLIPADLLPPAPRPQGVTTPWLCSLAMLLLGAVALRSAIGGVLSAAWRSPAFDAFALALAAAAGKVLGGLVADRFGWRSTSVFALLLAAPLVVAGLGHFALALAGMVVFQFSMPVTLAAMYRALPRWPGLAFGLPSLALLLGTLPGFTPVLTTHVQAVKLLTAPVILLSALLIYFGLGVVGSVRKHPSPEHALQA